MSTAATPRPHLGHALREIPTRGPLGPDVDPKVPQLYLTGFFGKMFPTLKALVLNEDVLKGLGAQMTDTPGASDDRSQESGIPALYTYFGQFITHDITFDPNSLLQKTKDPGLLVDFRTPALDLDCVYGRGPNDQPYMYTKPFGESTAKRFLTGTPFNSGHFGALDLPRNGDEAGRALIGDPRNDENNIVSQLHVLFLRFHNNMVSRVHPKALRLLRFEEAHRELMFHYQHIVLYDFLPRIINSKVLKAFRTKEGDGYDQKQIRFFRAQPDAKTPDGNFKPVSFPFMPLEFSVAAYRFGHSMVRQDYRLNENSPQEPVVPAGAQPRTSGSLVGFQRPNPNRGIDWGGFIDIEPRNYGREGDNNDPDNFRRLQFAHKIGTLLANPLVNLPTLLAADNPDTLASRDLIRGNLMGLPSAQDVAAAMKDAGVLTAEQILTEDQILIGKPDKDGKRKTIAEVDPSFAGKCPLWTYILAEAMQNAENEDISVLGGPPQLGEPPQLPTPKLGPVGGRIVAEVILGLLFADDHSVLNDKERWQPNAFDASGPVSKHPYTLVDFIRYATGHKNHPLPPSA